MSNLKKRIFYFIDIILIILALIWTLLPIFWTFITSISEETELTKVPASWFPSHPTFENYWNVFFKKAGTTNAFRVGLMNSFIISTVVSIISVFLGSLAAYAISRLKILSSNIVVFLLLFIQMIPPVILVTSLYVIGSYLKILDTKFYLGLIYLALNLPMAIWILKGYFDTLPKEIEDSALVDGCSPPTVLFRIVIPLSGPALFTTGIFTFIACWGEFLLALVLTDSLASKTMPVTISEFMGRFYVSFNLMATVGIVASIPPILIALAFQRLIIQGLTSGAVKE
ncbi:MAG: ABC transporter permease [Dictyoglomus sp. NZ13-RE01]|nr:MAG: ABC transporter permease [Dictyoglomus sp. NZ13-RE01]